jgi:hypothetical protein
MLVVVGACLLNPRWFQGILAANDTARMVAAVEAMKAFDSRPWLHQIACPMLVIAGAENTALPLPHAQMLVQGIHGARLRVDDAAEILSEDVPKRQQALLAAMEPADAAEVRMAPAIPTPDRWPSDDRAVRAGPAGDELV